MDPIKLNIDGLGACEMRPPSVGDLKDHLHLMSDDGQAFLIAAIGVSIYKDGARVENALDKIPFYYVSDMIGDMSKLLGFDPADEKETGND